MKIIVDNIKCVGCINIITKKLIATFNTKKVNINIEQGIVKIDVDSTKKSEVAQVLLNLGYPEINSIHGFNSTKAKAKSFVSCTIGRINI
ncbi:heavy-metal-associated domain-containing protein [Candidatus Vesicomyidisocius calyptogenae]|uniref:HMA domain-containing protein n=1 Tax=Vesicomyosocius okutanii subsp. Calyptogena okutanii (strain HA) TaxID=412965 RepID=A5CVX3_VESOH|nr:cation transporter [Candidatus Vesicomyosocius okutanii]BAF61908.1 conserved hypothetical protein [Candidatus Vesicomyosocius okutanii]